MIKMISHPGQDKNKMAPNRPVLASGDICLPQRILGIEAITQRIYLQVTGVENCLGARIYQLIEESSNVIGGLLQAGLAA